MTAPWSKALRDVWGGKARAILVVLAIAAGIAGFSAVLSAYAILTRELDRGYLATNPASATLWTDAVPDELTEAIVAETPVSAAEARRAVHGRIRTGPMQWRNLVLFVVRDYKDIRVSTLVPQEGAWPPAVGEILIERDAMQVAQARIGDTVLVRTTEGPETQLQLRGTVHDVGQAQARMENAVYGYINLPTLQMLGETPVLDAVKILVRENRFDEVHVRQVTGQVRTLLEARGHKVRNVEIPRPGRHPHADLMGMLLLAMSSFGILVLLLAGVLVVNLLTAMMAAQVRQIGVMKALGGTRFRIAGIYFAQAALLGVAAVAVALPLGMWGSRLLCLYMARFLNFDITSFAVPLWVYALVAAVGIVAPLLAAAHPVWKGCRVPVRQALDDYGVGRNAFGATRFDRMLASVQGIGRPLLLAMRNSFRRRSRFVLTVITLAAGGLFFMTALNVRASLILTLDRLFAQRKFDLSVALPSMQSVPAIERAIARTPGVARAEAWVYSEATLPGASAPSPATRHDGGGTAFTVLALPAGTTMLRQEFVEGRGLRAGEPDTLVVNTALAAKDRRLRPGQTVTLAMESGAATWRVVGVSDEPFSPAVAYVPRAYFDARRPGLTNSLRLALDRTDAPSIDRTKAALEENLSREGIHVSSSSSTRESRFGFDQHMVMIYIFLVVMSCIIVGVGGLGLMTTMSLNVLERRREMGVLRAVGASSRMVWLIVAGEGAVLGLVSWTVASLAAWPVSSLLCDFLVKTMFKSSSQFSFEWRGLFLWLAAAVVLSTLASFVPAWHASRGSVREALAFE
ncbi:MAG: ABC transporter permease [Acidobacteriota bacterium]